MKIELSNKKNIKFSDLKVGDTFYHNNFLCLKIVIFASAVYNSVNLNNNMPLSLYESTEVLPIKCKIVIDE
jgi:hypothetical protein